MLTTAELFAGIGGVTGGFVDAGGFEPVFLNDADPVAHSAFVLNFPALAERFRVGLVENIQPAALLDAAGGELDGLLGCPPCQGLSAAGLRLADDERNRLLNDFRRLVLGVRPRFFVMENVPGLLQSSLYRDFRATVGSAYLIRGEVVNAAEYGLPQLRRRAVVVGFRRDLGVRPSLPAPSHGGKGRVFDYLTGEYVEPFGNGRNALKLRPDIKFPPRELVTLGRAIGDLPAEVTPYEDSEHYAGPSTTTYQKRMRGAGRLRNHRGWRHGKEMRDRLARVAPGDCPRQYGGRSRNTRYFSQAYARLHPDGLARTITTNFHNPGGGRFTHYATPRTLTLREALRIQGFPDEFHFDMEELLHHEAERLVGNAFPRPLAEAIGRHIVELLS
jgi:DNA (cytosine-5)-methyltransferase 1